jgi:transcription antitermination factor NusA-like protein
MTIRNLPEEVYVVTKNDIVCFVTVQMDLAVEYAGEFAAAIGREGIRLRRVSNPLGIEKAMKDYDSSFSNVEI